MPARCIVFSHANSFPAGTYRVLFDAWRAAGFEVHAIEKLGHDPLYPVTSNWPLLRKQLIDFIEREHAQPAYLVGHSLGGLLSLMVAIRRPELAAGVVMLDSPLIAGWRAKTLQLVKATGLIRRISPGRIARRRRNEWTSADEAHAHFAAKRVFASWDPRVLRDYVASGIGRVQDRAVLAFEREVEASIYDTLPHHRARLLRRHPLRCPLGFVAGTRSAEMRQAGVAPSKALAGPHFRNIEGSHLFPMEQPERTAALVMELIDGFGCAPGD